MSGNWQISASTGQIEGLQRELELYFHRRLGDRIDPRDMANDTWLAAGRGYRKIGELRNYLFGIARRRVADVLRRQRRRPPPPDPFWQDLRADQPGGETALLLAVGHEAVERALAGVSASYRETVRLWLMGRDNFEIAGELGVPYHTARSRLSKGRGQLLEQLADELGVELEELRRLAARRK